MGSLNLSEEELRTYPRWYTDLLLRKGKQNSVEIDDLTSFLENFGLKDEDKQRLVYLFDPPLSTLDPTSFYIFIRLVSHIMQGNDPEPSLMYSQAPIPRPRSILSTKRKSEGSRTSSPPVGTSQPPPGNPFRKNANNNSNPKEESGKKKIDIDSFTTFMLTGSMPENKKEEHNNNNNDGADNEVVNTRPKKRVSFDPDPPQVAEAAARSLDELMRQRQAQTSQQQHQQQLVPPQQPNSSYQGPMDPYGYTDDTNNNNQQEEEEDDVEIDTSAFQNVNIDSVLRHGVSNVPESESTFQWHPSNSPSPTPESQLQQPGAYLQPQNIADSNNMLKPPGPPPPPPPPPSRRGGAPSSPNLTPSASFQRSPSPNAYPQLSNNNNYINGGPMANPGGPMMLQQQNTNNAMHPLQPQHTQQQYFNNGVVQPQQPLQSQNTANSGTPQIVQQPVANGANTLPTIAPPPPQPRRTRNPPPQPLQQQSTGPPAPPPPPPRRKSGYSVGPGGDGSLNTPPSIASSPGLPNGNGNGNVQGFQPLQQPQTTSAPDLLADLKALQDEVDRIRHR